MSKCEKLQRIVKQGATTFRCLNNRSGVYTQEIDEDVCSRCPTKVTRHKRKCPKLSGRHTIVNQDPEGYKELVDTQDPEIVKMIQESGINIEEFEKTQVPNYPSISMQVWSYKEALIKWNKAGRPKRTQEEVEHIHSSFCASGCDWYDEKAQRCKGCGCAVTVGSLAVFNKIKMGTEHCPKDKW
jgi:hypothetical protein